MKQEKKHLNVVAAVIFEAGSVYCFRRGDHKLKYLSNRFEFPGGKIELGENKLQAIKREVFEELDVKVDVLNELLEFDFEYPDFSMTLTCFACNIAEGTIRLNEHVEVVLCEIPNLERLDWLPAELPAVKFIMDNYNG